MATVQGTGRSTAAKLADLEALPAGVRGEIIDGVLYTFPRPRPRHARVATFVSGDLLDPFYRGRRGPGGWVILIEPGIGAPGSPEYVPDVAGWRRERLPQLPEGRIEVAPDWVCEVLSPGSRGYDFRVKRPFYARLGVRHLWYVDPEERTLAVSALEGGRWTEVLIAGEDDLVHAPPFEAVAIALADWWDQPPPPGPDRVAEAGADAAR